VELVLLLFTYTSDENSLHLEGEKEGSLESLRVPLFNSLVRQALLPGPHKDDEDESTAARIFLQHLERPVKGAVE
jgi:hypothetical protein